MLTSADTACVGQLVQPKEPTKLLYVPVPQAVQLPPLAASPVNPAPQPQLTAPAADTALLGQLVHATEPVTYLYVPTAHATQLPGLPSTTVKPASQAATQSDADVLAWGDAAFPGHEEHPAAPSESLYVLAGHAVQIPPLEASPEKPGAHWQLLNALLPSAETALSAQLTHTVSPLEPWYFPDGHAVHDALPVAFLNFPAPHAVQGPPSLPVYPTEQMHAVTATLPLTDTPEPDGHDEQSAEPAVAAYVPSEHEEHFAVPVTSVYVPAPHAVQLPPLAASPVNPVGHLQLVLPSADTALLGQLVHTTEPMVLLYVPAVQVLHEVAPVLV